MTAMIATNDARRVLIPVTARSSARDDAAGRTADPAAAPAARVRRYRLGRMPAARSDDRFGHLRRVYD